MHHAFIIIKGKPKALQIEKFNLGSNGVYAVKFKNSHTIFHYRFADVVCLKEFKWHDYLHCKVYIKGIEQHNIADIRSFQQGVLTHWRITFSNGYVQDYLDGTIHVSESCLVDDKAKSSFEFLKRVAKINELGKDENEENNGILSSLYDKIDFIDNSLAIAPYLNPDKYKVLRTKSQFLIFPFGCNASQEKAVAAAFENQISVIQGPPGTGKTQTILNIISNIILQGKTVIVVSNNNSAIVNVLEKLEKYDLGFIVASLGRRENKKAFILHQPPIPVELKNWKYNGLHEELKTEILSVRSKLKEVFELQEEQSLLKQELCAVELEWGHFKRDYNIEDDTYIAKKRLKSKCLLNLWLSYQAFSENDVSVSCNFFKIILKRVKLLWMNFVRKYLFGMKSVFDPKNVHPVIQELQSLYYIVRIAELKYRINEIEQNLISIDAKSLISNLTTLSMIQLKNILYERYSNGQRNVYADVSDLRLYADEVCKQYPVILSTTFSARTSIPDKIYDYIIMDEASQVSIETGALSLTCAKNAVIVGDELQLPNVVKQEDKIKLNAIFDEYKVHRGYKCSDYSFLQSVCTVLPDIGKTLLREHYRCHPKIINFCNQKYYGGSLLIMTEDNNESDVMMVKKTVPGNHSRKVGCNKSLSVFNEREIKVIIKEVIPKIITTDVGIITPYNAQVNEFHRQIPEIEAATIHKYQGREKDAIILSTVDDQMVSAINDCKRVKLSDDPNIVNVAVSRAKKQFIVVVSGNEQDCKGNISDLIDYIEYNNFSVTESKISSVFDYLYTHYTEERIAFLSGHANISEFDSENLIYVLIENIISEYTDFKCLGILCHIPLRCVIRDSSLMSDEERKYVSHYGTHIDFLIINHVTKKPVLAIETDGFSYHKEGTEQYQRDLMKNHILEVYCLPLLRLSTIGTGEKEKIVSTLSEIIGKTVPALELSEKLL